MLKSLGAERLKVESAQHVRGRRAAVDERDGQAGLPINRDTKRLSRCNGIPARKLAIYRGGAAIVLRDITPPLSPSEIRDRIERAASAAAGRGRRSRPIAISRRIAEAGPDAPTNLAVVLVVRSELCRTTRTPASGATTWPSRCGSWSATPSTSRRRFRRSTTSIRRSPAIRARCDDGADPVDRRSSWPTSGCASAI